MSQRPSAVVRIQQSGRPQSLAATTLQKLGKSEEVLEAAIADHPSLMGLENRRSGIRGPFKVFRQLSLPTPSERLIYPDIVMLAASGHVVVAEVKLGSNPELKNRAVIAQIVDYAASFSGLSEGQVTRMFDTEKSGLSWDKLVEQWFAGERDIDELAQVLLERMKAGELNLVIACDRVPLGLPDVISGIVSVRPLGFDLDLVEVVPFVSPTDDEILLVPSTRLQTEIVARTAVTIRSEDGAERAGFAVEATSASSIIENVKRVSDTRRWSLAEVEEAVAQDGSPIEQTLFEFAKQHSYRGECVSSGMTKLPSFGLSIPIVVNGKSEPKRVFSCVLGWGGPTINLNQTRNHAPPDVDAEFRERLAKLFGSQINTEGSMPGIAYEYLEPKINEFCDLMLWLKEKVGQNEARSDPQ